MIIPRESCYQNFGGIGLLLELLRHFSCFAAFPQNSIHYLKHAAIIKYRKFFNNGTLFLTPFESKCTCSMNTMEEILTTHNLSVVVSSTHHPLDTIKTYLGKKPEKFHKLSCLLDGFYTCCLMMFNCSTWKGKFILGQQ